MVNPHKGTLRIIKKSFPRKTNIILEVQTIMLNKIYNTVVSNFVLNTVLKYLFSIHRKTLVEIHKNPKNELLLANGFTGNVFHLL